MYLVHVCWTLRRVHKQGYHRQTLSTMTLTSHTHTYIIHTYACRTNSTKVFARPYIRTECYRFLFSPHSYYIVISFFTFLYSAFTTDHIRNTGIYARQHFFTCKSCVYFLKFSSNPALSSLQYPC